MAQNIEPTAGTDSDDIGFVVQGGYYFNDDTEGFLRYDFLMLDDNRITAAGSGNDEISTITVGVNHYLHGHAAKITVDLNFALDEAAVTGASGGAHTVFTNPGIGYLGDDDSDELYIRAQLQLLF